MGFVRSLSMSVMAPSMMRFMLTIKHDITFSLRLYMTAIQTPTIDYSSRAGMLGSLNKTNLVDTNHRSLTTIITPLQNM